MEAQKVHENSVDFCVLVFPWRNFTHKTFKAGIAVETKKDVMNYYTLVYKTVDNFVEERQPYRVEHLALATEHLENGSLILGGALDNPADEALLVFKGNDAEIARSFAENDPYVKNGLIKEWTVRKWNVVIGDRF